MVLHVEFGHLAEEAKRQGAKPWAYLSRSGGRTFATMADPSTNTILQASTPLGLDEARGTLVEQGLLVAAGRWTPDPQSGEIQIAEATWVAAVAYRSSEDRPGLWVHAYAGEPTVGDVVRDLYEELSSEADLSDVPLDDFIEAVCPNVVVLGPDQLAAYASQGPCADD